MDTDITVLTKSLASLIGMGWYKVVVNWTYGQLRLVLNPIPSLPDSSSLSLFRSPSLDYDSLSNLRLGFSVSKRAYGCELVTNASLIFFQ